ncbi:MAG: dTDP-4-dehydrorhamnose reductase [Verrucomicrobiales bacterium]|nr:dTDP-4-dehydrorhamnose reductase [Verrucomicrobiales bacterium]
MIVLLGHTGYIGSAFFQVLHERGIPFVSPTRKEMDYTDFGTLFSFLQKLKPTFLLNAAGYTGKPNVDACEIARADTLQGNSLFPAMLAHACQMLNIPWGHVSSGCIFAGAKVFQNGAWQVEKDLTLPAIEALAASHPEAFRGFTEEDQPNFSFRSPPCSFYSGSKALGEEALTTAPQTYIWRLRIPFDHLENSRNVLTKFQKYSKVYNNINSLSHRFDFVNACLDLWLLNAPFGTYNLTNPGFTSSREIIGMMKKFLKIDREFEFWSSDEDFYKVAAKTPRSNCILDTSKLLATGVKMRSVHEALEHSLKHWTPSLT